MAGALAILATAGCGSEPDDTSRYTDSGLRAAEVPPAFRAPLGVMTAIGRRGLAETLDICDDFRLTVEGEAAEADAWRSFGRSVDDRLGQRAGVLTDISDYAPAENRVTILSRPIGGEAPALETDWQLRTTAAGNLDCVASVDMREVAA